MSVHSVYVVVTEQSKLLKVLVQVFDKLWLKYCFWGLKPQNSSIEINLPPKSHNLKAAKHKSFTVCVSISMLLAVVLLIIVQQDNISLSAKHANSVVAYFEYFCQMSSKLILIISSYTVSRLVHSFRHSAFPAKTTEVLTMERNIQNLCVLLWLLKGKRAFEMSQCHYPKIVHWKHQHCH